MGSSCLPVAPFVAAFFFFENNLSLLPAPATGTTDLRWAAAADTRVLLLPAAATGLRPRTTCAAPGPLPLLYDHRHIRST
jgi:hypothetical protein